MYFYLLHKHCFFIQAQLDSKRMKVTVNVGPFHVITNYIPGQQANLNDLQQPLSTLSAPEPCSPGKYLDSDLGECLSCRFGTYQPLSGQMHCINCPFGLRTEHVGSTNLSDCVCELNLLQNIVQACSPSFCCCSVLPVGTVRIELRERLVTVRGMSTQHLSASIAVRVVRRVSGRDSHDKHRQLESVSVHLRYRCR